MAEPNLTPNDMNKLKLNDCGKHWGHGGRCSKCSLHADYQRKGYLQYQGTPWSEVIGQPVEQSIQERAIKNAHLFNNR